MIAGANIGGKVRPFYHGKGGVLLLAHYDLRVFGCISFQIANHLVQRGVPPGAVDSQGATPLHYAACNHNLAFCRFLWGKNFNNNFFQFSKSFISSQI